MCAGHDHKHGRPGSLRGTLRNLAAGDHPFPQRLLMVGQAYWRRLSRAQLCCGYYGEPGC